MIAAGSPGRRRHRGVRSDINVAPLVDVVLVLLIVFMVVTPLLQRGVPLRLPGAARTIAPAVGAHALVVSVTADGRTYLEGREVARRDLAVALAARHPAAAGAVVVRGDRAADYGSVRAVLRDLARAGVTGVSLAARPAAEAGR